MADAKDEKGVSVGAIVVIAVVIVLAMGQTDANNRVAATGRKVFDATEAVGGQLGRQLGSNGGTQSATQDGTGAFAPSNAYGAPTIAPMPTAAPETAAPVLEGGAAVPTVEVLEP